MGFLSALGNLATAVSDVLGSDDYATIAMALGVVGTKKSYTKEAIEKMEDNRNRISFTVRKTIRDDDIDLDSLPSSVQHMVMCILENVEKDGDKYVTPGFTASEWIEKSEHTGLPANGILSRDKIIRMSKRW